MTHTTALFAQYHPSGRLLPHTHAALSALLDSECALHVACAADIDDPDPASVQRVADLQARGATFHPRRNGGLDFGSWQALLRLGCARGAQRVLLANDSVLGPFRPLAPILHEMRTHLAWGMVASRQIRPHLQSWFVCLDAAMLSEAPVARVLEQDFASMTRDEIVLHGEIGLSVALEAAGVVARARWPHAPRPTLLPPVNPAHADWRRMLGDVPFIKIELLRDDPARLAPPRLWHAELRRLGYPLDWAEAAIAATPRRRDAVQLNWRGRLAQRLPRL